MRRNDRPGRAVIDLHCHILPGLDDGPRNWDEALAMARLADADGVQLIVATPHCNLDATCPSPVQIRDLTAQLNQLLETNGLRLRVVPGAEARATTGLVEAVEAGRVLTLGDRGRFLLVELPPSGQPLFAAELFFRLRLAGVTPVIAHAERYDFFRSAPGALQELADRLYPIQVNAGSLLGREGWRIRRSARDLVRRGLATIVASDGHNATDRKPVLAAVERALRLSREAFAQLAFEHPLALLRQKAGPAAAPSSGKKAGEGRH